MIRKEIYNMSNTSPKFAEAYKEFLASAQKLSEVWEAEQSDGHIIKLENYPQYMPSFDDFVSDMEWLSKEVIGKLGGE